MKKLMRIIPLLALVIGMTAAFADQSDPVVARKEALNAQDVWVVITGQEQDDDYTCEEELNRICTRSFDAEDNPIPELQEDGRYIPNP